MYILSEYFQEGTIIYGVYSNYKLARKRRRLILHERTREWIKELNSGDDDYIDPIHDYLCIFDEIKYFNIKEVEHSTFELDKDITVEL